MAASDPSNERREVVYNLPPRNPSFVGRDIQLAAFENGLEERTSTVAPWNRRRRKNHAEHRIRRKRVEVLGKEHPETVKTMRLAEQIMSAAEVDTRS
ncbi:hypothetical protein [Micromonospora aurantiaca (nom. illeg.)]|uniref:hypothetical protein n=1 Tax=Micromonospora aurantiaca (nom. illeg.) TaxID=47850 RepID=UPI0035ADEC7B